MKPARGAAVLMLLCAAGAGAQPTALTVVPSVGVTMTATDNRALSRTDRESDLITELRPAITLASRRGALQGVLNYALTGVSYARDSDANTVYHDLAANGRWVLLDGRAGVEATARAGRQIVSAYGLQSHSAYRAAGNQTQVASYSLSPYVNGPLLGTANYHGRVIFSDSRSDSDAVNSNVKSLSALAGIGGRLGGLGWGLDASRTIYDVPDRARSHNGRVVASLSVQPDPDWQASARAGSEVDDIRSGRSERQATWGVGGQWQPTPRTVLRADYDRRFYGRSHMLMASHRTARTVWTLSDVRSLNMGGVGGRLEVSAYDLFYAQFASVEPDPRQREALVRSFLAANGLDPDASVTIGGFLNAGPTVQRNQTATVAYRGQRTTMVLALMQSRTARIGDGQGSSGDLALTDGVRQRSVNLSVSHRLTPSSSLVVSGSLRRTPGTRAIGGNELQTYAATWSWQLGRSTSGSLGLRHTRFDSVSRPYDENALIGSVRMLF